MLATKNLTRRANHRHNDIIRKYFEPAEMVAGYFGIASTDADEGAPDGSEAGAYQDKVRTVAEHAAIATHLDAERSDLVIARGIEQARQYDQDGGDEIHRISPGLPVIVHAVPTSDRHFVKILRAPDRDIAQLTCRANQGHIDIIARTIKPAPKKSVSGLFVCAAIFAKMVSRRFR
jgi:hypothetical protein